MKSMSVLAVAASVAVLAAACSTKHEPVTSETNTTGAPVVVGEPAVTPQITTGTLTTDTTETVGTTLTSRSIQKSKDAGVATDWPSGGTDLLDRDGNVNAKEPGNHSTPLGDSKSGEYTGGKGTYGGKATWGTGPRKGTKMDQPTKK